MIEQVSGASADELQSSFRQKTGLDHRLHHPICEVRSYRCGFHDCRNAGKECRREFLKHSPAREIECVNVNRNAFKRHANMPPDKGSVF
jgi:hypothetical protein